MSDTQSYVTMIINPQNDSSPRDRGAVRTVQWRLGILSLFLQTKRLGFVVSPMWTVQMNSKVYYSFDG